jgi:Fe-S cluster biogenesis protein NfuA/nitrite reductase/ring-hydroxylating ferredoxin subunit
MAEGPPGFPHNETRPGAAVDGGAVPALDDGAARERVARVDALLQDIEGAIGAVPVDTAIELAQALLDLYGEGLARIVGHVAEHDDGALARAFAADELVSHLLLLHGLHPVPLDTRVRGALAEVRPYLESHGGDVELLAIEDGVVRLAMRGSCDGCASSTMTLTLAIEEAIQRAAPDVEEIVAEGAVEAAPPAPVLLQIELSDGLRAGGSPAGPGTGDADSAWTAAGDLPDVREGEPVVLEVAGAPLLFVALDGGRYAYRPECPACGASLGGAALAGAELRCGGCGTRFDVRHAGRGLDAPEHHLEPVPLLVGADGVARVALGAPA